MIRAIWIVAGLWIAVLGAIVHRHGSEVAGIDVPWGLIVASAPLVPLALLADRTVSLGAVALLIGWALVLMLQGSISPGDYLIGNDALGWIHTALGLGCLAAVVVRNSRLAR